ncbi:MAG: diaminopimelate decarboxylase family protein [Acidobacteriota bacterium]|jgi:diaminopimelate decarboxylase|nr:pyridoxal-dependent decarboxylase, pyridoxal binding domain protein [Bryobacteraceae bacterium CoA2 C42]
MADSSFVDTGCLALDPWAAKLDQAALAKAYNTPLYILNADQLRRNAAQFAALTGSINSIAYPVKANPSISVLRILAQLGCSADCATGHEVRAALAAGFPVTSLVYNSPVPDRSLLGDLYHQGATIIADSEPILHHLAQTVSPSAAAGRLLLRVNPAEPIEYLDRQDWHAHTSHSSSSAKFGIPAEEIPAIAAACSLPIDGLHIHVGTQMDHLGPFPRSLALLHQLADAIADRTGRRLTCFDLGGGLGIPFQPGQHFPSITAYVESVRPHLRKDCHYWIEPGHALVGDAVALLSRIREVKQIRGRRWALLDVGTDQLAKVTLLHWPHPILTPEGKALPTEGPDAIGGPHCFAGDILLPQTRLGNLQTGDTLLIQRTGAYCFALANHFNGLLGPAHVEVDDSGHLLAHTNRAEDWFFETGHLSYRWPLSVSSPGDPLPPALVEELSSQYLHRGAAQDQYTILSVQPHGPGQYHFRVVASSPLGLVSIPLVIRMVGDAAIIGCLHHAGKLAKDIAVWGTRLALTAESKLPTDTPLDLHLTITPPFRRSSSSLARSTAHWEFPNTSFHGAFRLVW